MSFFGAFSHNFDTDRHTLKKPANHKSLDLFFNLSDYDHYHYS